MGSASVMMRRAPPWSQRRSNAPHQSVPRRRVQQADRPRGASATAIRTDASIPPRCASTATGARSINVPSATSLTHHGRLVARRKLSERVVKTDRHRKNGCPSVLASSSCALARHAFNLGRRDRRRWRNHDRDSRSHVARRSASAPVALRRGKAAGCGDGAAVSGRPVSSSRQRRQLEAGIVLRQDGAGGFAARRARRRRR